MGGTLFKPEFVQSSCDKAVLNEYLNTYEEAMNAKAADLKILGKTISDQDFECCAFSLDNDGDTHLLLLGGMGPLAGVHGMKKVLENCDGKKSITLFQACGIPQRRIDEDITEVLEHAVSNALKQCPKDKPIELIVLCNSAHKFIHKALSNKHRRIKLCSLKHSVETNARLFEGQKNVVLQTEFSAQSGIYGKNNTLRSLHEIPELATLQKSVTEIINGVKSFDKYWVLKHAFIVFEHLKEWGAQKLLLGCTELPVALEYLKNTDNTQVLNYLKNIELIDPLHLTLGEIKKEHRF